MKTYYAIQLTTPGAQISRFALYYVNKNGNLEIEWPTNSHLGKGATLLPHQIYYKGVISKYPAFHFMIGNIGYNKLQCLKESLAQHYKCKVEVSLISGWAPSTR
jgi:hypothetical protein